VESKTKINNYLILNWSAADMGLWVIHIMLNHYRNWLRANPLIGRKNSTTFIFKKSFFESPVSHLFHEKNCNFRRNAERGYVRYQYNTIAFTSRFFVYFPIFTPSMATKSRVLHDEYQHNFLAHQTSYFPFLYNNYRVSNPPLPGLFYIIHTHPFISGNFIQL